MLFSGLFLTLQAPLSSFLVCCGAPPPNTSGIVRCHQVAADGVSPTRWVTESVSKGLFSLALDSKMTKTNRSQTVEPYTPLTDWYDGYCRAGPWSWKLPILPAWWGQKLLSRHYKKPHKEGSLPWKNLEAQCAKLSEMDCPSSSSWLSTAVKYTEKSWWASQYHHCLLKVYPQIPPLPFLLLGLKNLLLESNLKSRQIAGSPGPLSSPASWTGCPTTPSGRRVPTRMLAGTDSCGTWEDRGETPHGMSRASVKFCWSRRPRLRL